ncbi:MAG: mechanosensitive ion channel family protein, partial [Pseudomonadota bacterium]|nr:mechanosensitive ion channel family protein [Pseudomonadota bacterium]
MPLSALLRCLTLCLAMIAALWALTGIAMAQTAEGDLAQAIRDAMESGARVIILNGDGTLAGTTGEGTPAADTPAPMKDASALMQAQAEISGFRETLLERLAALPNSLNEVAFILRATSPDGQISTYVHALLWTLVLLFIGRFAAVHIYGQRLMRGF